MSELQCTIANVSNEIVEVIQIRQLGTQLELSPSRLDEIEAYPKHEQRLRLVEAWFQQDPTVTWENLVAALRAPSIGDNTIALDIEKRYITIRSPPSSPQLEEEMKGNTAGTSVNC